MNEINLEVAQKVLTTVKAGLVSGVGKPVPGQMCVEAAVCFALGLPHGDDPKCVAQSLRRLKIRLNDSAWSDDYARAKGLERLALAQSEYFGTGDPAEQLAEYEMRELACALQETVENYFEDRRNRARVVLPDEAAPPAQRDTCPSCGKEHNRFCDDGWHI